MSRMSVQPAEVTSKAQGTYYCYAIQAWIVDGVVTDVGQGVPGTYHGACPDCH